MKLEIRKWDLGDGIYHIFIDDMDMNVTIKRDNPKYPIWTSLESENADLTKLKEAVEWMDNHPEMICGSRNIEDDESDSRWAVWNESKPQKTCWAATLSAAVADYKAKNPEQPGTELEVAKELLKDIHRKLTIGKMYKRLPLHFEDRLNKIDTFLGGGRDE